MKLLIVCASGKKRSGKNTLVNFIAASFLKRNGNIKDFKINKLGLIEARKNDHWFTVEEGEFNTVFGNGEIRLYSFADCLKEFCIDVLGLTHEQCYGTEEQKNSLTQLKFEDMPSKLYNMDSVAQRGFMTARQVLQYFGTDIIRNMCDNAWVNATINKIRRDAATYHIKLALITDARFPNEINTINEIGGKTIRLLRDVAGKDVHVSETVLDDYPRDKFSLVIDNRNMSVDEQCDFIKPHIEQWLDGLAGK
jgi:hypothetical protein